ncbi:MAG: peptidoglycan DD-metalloendopeptidase family protein [Deltaproteobacteria bacterium]|nr:peptidoglycan DD-metalloendopeptidase family protein [Deltaproteobacteria bacterium]
MQGRFKIWLLVALLLALGACQPKRHPALVFLSPSPETEAVGLFHEVQAGESLGAIARTYGTDVQDLAEVNGIEDANRIKVGQRIFVPDAVEAKQVEGVASAAQNRVVKQLGKYIWPVDGVLTSRFGIRRGRRHDGIDIGAPEGTPIHAAASGQVLYVGEQSGYGNLVILRHDKGAITVYAHNLRNLVKEGESVEQGQKIALVGKTGRATGPHLHFEIRQGRRPRNPLFFLPKP